MTAENLLIVCGLAWAGLITFCVTGLIRDRQADDIAPGCAPTHSPAARQGTPGSGLRRVLNHR